MKDLAGKVAIVTGGARGIGKAIVNELASRNVKVIAVDVLEDQVSETADECKANGYDVTALGADLRDMSALDKIVDFTVDTYGTVDILVNVAAIQIRRASVNFTEDEWDFINDVNLKSQFFLAQKVAKVMLPKGKGSIICISSATSTRFTSRRVPYNVTKAAVNALAGALGNEWARFGVRVNAIAPGWNATEMVKDGLKAGIINEGEILPMMPVNRFMEPSELANVVAFLASDMSSAIVGQTIYADGGGSIRCINESNDFAYDQND